MNKEIREWAEKAAEASQGVIDSDIYAGLATENFMKSPLCALQMGMAILHDKPIVLIVDEKVKLPEALIRVAKMIRRVDLNNEAERNKAFRAIKDFSENLGK